MVQSISSRAHAELREILQAYLDEYTIYARRQETNSFGLRQWAQIRLTRKPHHKPRDRRAILLLLAVTAYLDRPGFHTSLKSMLSAWIANETTVSASSANSGE